MNPGRDRFFIQLGRDFPCATETDLCRIGNRLLAAAATIAAMPNASQAVVDLTIETGDLYTLVDALNAAVVTGFINGRWRLVLRDSDGRERTVPIQ